MRYEVYLLGIEFNGWKYFGADTVEAVYKDFLHWYSYKNRDEKFVFLFFVGGKFMSYLIDDIEKIKIILEMIKDGRS